MPPRRQANNRLPHHQVADGVDMVARQVAGLNWLQQLGLIVLDDALPIVDDDRRGALKSATIDLRAFVGDVRVGHRNDHLAVFQPIAQQHRFHRRGTAQHHIGSPDRFLRVLCGAHRQSLTRRVLDESREMFGRRTEHDNVAEGPKPQRRLKRDRACLPVPNGARRDIGNAIKEKRYAGMP